MTEEELQLLMQGNIAVLEAYYPYLAAQIRQQLVLGYISGSTEAQVLQNITDATLSDHQIRTLVDTTLFNYSRTVTYMQMQEEPDDTLYQYIGPIDDKTRDVCLQMGSSQPITQKEIIKNFGRLTPNPLIYAGGYNCRHKWQSESRVGVSKRIYDPDKAKELRKDGD